MSKRAYTRHVIDTFLENKYIGRDLRRVDYIDVQLWVTQNNVFVMNIYTY